MNFNNLPVEHLSKLKKIEDFDNYANGLALLDDLLCRYDIIPRYPEYLPSGTDPELAGTPTLLARPIQECINDITSYSLRKNLEENFKIALSLYEERKKKQAEIHSYLAELIRQYSEVIHPAVYPNKSD